MNTPTDPQFSEAGPPEEGQAQVASPKKEPRWWSRLMAGAALQWVLGVTIQTGVIIGAGFALMNFMLSGTNTKIDSLQASMISQFSAMNSRFESIEGRLAAMDQRLDGIAETQSEHSERFNSIDKEFVSVRSELAGALEGLRFSIDRIDPTAVEPLEEWGQLLLASLAEENKMDEAMTLSLNHPELFSVKYKDTEILQEGAEAEAPGTSVMNAETALGTWQTQADKNSPVMRVEVTPCDSGLCGEIMHIYDSEGNRINTENVGKRVFWDVKPTGDGGYLGQAWVPEYDRETSARMELETKDRLKVSGCLGPICQSQIWLRVE